MVLIDGKERYIDPYLIKVLDFSKKDIKQNWDQWFLASGREGAGKSTLMEQMCYYVNQDFNIDDIVFTPDQFRERIQTSSKRSILYDEAITGFLSQAGLNKTTAELLRLAAQCRKRNNFVCLCIPSYFAFHSNIAVHRADALFYIDAPPDDAGNKKRGTYYYYNYSRKRSLYIKGKRLLSMDIVKSNFKGSFTNWSVVDRDAYEKKKDEALQQLGIDSAEAWKQQRDKAISMLSNNGMSKTSIAELIGLDRKVIQSICKKAELGAGAYNYVEHPVRGKKIPAPPLLN